MFFMEAAICLAVSLDGSSRSYLKSEDSISRDNLLPGYEYLDLSIRDIGSEEISVHFGGWARYDFIQETATSDLQYAYLSYRRKTDNFVINLGRVMVFEGVAAERVDGGYARTDLLGNFGIAAFGGIPVETDIDTAGNNLIYGARLSQQTTGLYQVGVSALREEKNDTRFREEEGVDVWFRPANSVQLFGRSSYDSIGDQWMEHAYHLIAGPYRKLTLDTEVSNYHYASYFRGTTTPALQFTAGLLDPNETATILGEEVTFEVNDKISIFANYRFYGYKVAGSASSYGGRVNYSRGKETAAGFSVNRMDGDDIRLRYIQYRLYGAQTVGPVHVALDLIDVNYDEDINSTANSYSASIALNYELTRSLSVGGDFEYRTSPMLTRDHISFVKIIYLFGWKIGGGV